MVQITVCWGGEFQGSEANVVESLVIDTVSLVGVLNKLVNGQGGVIWFYNCVWYLKAIYRLLLIRNEYVMDM